MKTGIKRRCFLILLACMVMLSGCNGDENKENVQVQAVPEKTTDSFKEEGEDEQKKQEFLRLYLGETSKGLSPFFFLTAGDERLLDLLYKKVYPESDKGSDTAKPSTGGAAEIKVIKKAKSSHTIYRITIQENIWDQAGNDMTSEDLLFNYYLRCQLDYRGLDQINRMHIVGLEKYWYGASGKKLRTRKKRVQERLSYPTRGIAKKLRREIILPALKREYAWTEDIYLDGSQKKLIAKYPQVSMLFARYFAPDTNYTGKGKSKKQVLNDVAKQYGGDIRKLSRVTGEDYTVAARRLIIRHLWKKQKKGTGKIAGIRKKDDRTIEIETTDFQKKDLERLGNLYLLSSHGYSVSGKNQELPPGTGFYCLEEKTGDCVWLVSNDYYPGGAPGIDRIQIVLDAAGKGEDVSVECVRKIAEGELDMAVVWERISRERESLRKALETGDASWKVAADGGVLYSTERINATTMPVKMTATQDVMDRIRQLELN